LPESRLALQILSRKVGIRTLVATIDQFDMQKVLQEEFPQAHVIFTPSEKNIEKTFQVTCGLGFDLIIDYSGMIEGNRRQIMKMLSIFGRLITTSTNLQLDPPETKILS